MRGGGIFLQIERSRNAPLRPRCIRLVDRALRRNRNGESFFRAMQRKQQSGCARSNDEDVGAHYTAIMRSMLRRARIMISCRISVGLSSLSKHAATFPSSTNFMYGQ